MDGMVDEMVDEMLLDTGKKVEAMQAGVLVKRACSGKIPSIGSWNSISQSIFNP